MDKDKLKNLGSNTNSYIRRKDLSSEPIEYYTHYNCGRPFKVIVTMDCINIYEESDDFDPHEEKYNYKENPLLSITDFIGFWPGFDTCEDSDYHGNSILIRISKKSYIFIGNVITRFKTDDKILDYMSPVGNNDVPYPIAFSSKYVYFMLDNVYVKKDNLDVDAIPINAEDMYLEFYDNDIFSKSNPFDAYPDNGFEKIQMINFKKFINKKFR